MEKVTPEITVNTPLAFIGNNDKKVTGLFGFNTGNNSSGFISKTRQFGAWLTGGAPEKAASNDVKMLTVFGTHTF